MSTPIQKRLAVDRVRNQAIIFLVAAGFFAALLVIDVVFDRHFSLEQLFLGALAITWLIRGLVSLRSARRKREELEAVFGPGAGVQ